MTDALEHPHAVRRRAARGHGARLRGELLLATMDLLAETDDEEAVSLRAVAQRVGVSVPSIYLHFHDKQSLIDAVCGEVFEALHVRMRAAAQDAPDPFEALRLMGAAYVHFALQNPEHYRIVTSRRPGDGKADLTSIGGAFGSLVETVQVCTDGGVLTGDPVELALRLWSAAHGVATLLIGKPDLPWADVDAFVDRTVSTAVLGLAASALLAPAADEPLGQVVARLEALTRPEVGRPAG